MNKQQALKNSQAQIEKIKIGMALIELLPDMEQIERITANDETVHIVLPYNPEILRKYRELMGEDWNQNTSSTTHHNDGTISQCTSFTHKELPGDILVAMQTGLEGSTCEIKQVGEKTVPILEVVCN